MRTEKQIHASRENAKKSTGPRTPEGKARSSKNALKHGLLSQDAVIPGEDPAEFDRHLTLYEDTYLPHNCIERELVRQIADAAWRMRRLSRIETTIIRAAIERTRTFQETVCPDRMREGHEGDLQLLGSSMYSGTQFLSQLARYDGHLNRRFHRAVELMMKIRKEDRKLREAENKDATNRDRGVDGSPRSTSPPAWKESEHDHAVSQDEAPKTPIGFRPANPQNQKPPNEANPNLTPTATTSYEETKAPGDAPASRPTSPVLRTVPPVLRSAGLKETCGFLRNPKASSQPQERKSTTPTNHESTPPTQSTPHRQPTNRERDARSVSESTSTLKYRAHSDWSIDL